MYSVCICVRIDTHTHTHTHTLVHSLTEVRGVDLFLKQKKKSFLFFLACVYDYTLSYMRFIRLIQ